MVTDSRRSVTTQTQWHNSLHELWKDRTQQRTTLQAIMTRIYDYHLSSAGMQAAGLYMEITYDDVGLHLGKIELRKAGAPPALKIALQQAVLNFLRHLVQSGYAQPAIIDEATEHFYPQYRTTHSAAARHEILADLTSLREDASDLYADPLIEAALDVVDPARRLAADRQAMLKKIIGTGSNSPQANAWRSVALYCLLSQDPGSRSNTPPRGIRTFQAMVQNANVHTWPIPAFIGSEDQLRDWLHIQGDLPLPEYAFLAMCNLQAISVNLPPPYPCAKLSVGGMSLHRSNLSDDKHCYYTVTIRKYNARKWLKPLRKLFPPTSTTDFKHMPILIDQLIYAIIHQQAACRAEERSWGTTGSRVRRVNDVLSNLPVGSNQVLASTVVIQALGSKQRHTFMTEIVSSRVLMCSQQVQHATLECLSSLYRRTSMRVDGTQLSADEVSALAYLQLCFGRSRNVTDWRQEYINRCQTQHHIKAPVLPEISNSLQANIRQYKLGDLKQADHTFYSLLNRELDDIVAKIIRPNQISEPFTNFWRRRSEWIASGSSGGYAVQVKLHDGKEVRVPVNKRAWGENVKESQILSYLYHKRPREEAVASEKYENGKSRAIYGVCPEHYVINTYVTKGMEESLHKVAGLEKGASGLQELGQVAKRLRITASKDTECTMLDYADFNIHHTPAAQYYLFKSILRAGIRAGASRDWQRAAEWLAEAKLDQRVRFPGATQTVKVTQGMFSGTRSTDLINTILNLAYFRVANSYLATQGVYPKDLYHVHQGDDVWLSNRNPLWPRLIFYVLSEQGFIFQQSKQMFGQGRGEFLRVLYQHGSARGYCVRSLVNLLLKPLQQSLDLNAQAWAHSTTETMRVLSRRGTMLSMCRAIYFHLLDNSAVVKAHARDRKPVLLPKVYVYAAPEFGGLGCPPPGSLITNTVSVELPQHVPDYDAEVCHAESNMTDDWIAHVSSRAPATARQINVSVLKASMVRDNYQPSLSQVSRDRARPRYKKAFAKASAPLRQVPIQLRPASNDLELHAQLHSMKPSDVPLCPTGHHYVRSHLRHATIDPDAAVDVTSIASGLKKMIIQNRFKNEARMAQAYGITRWAALALILQEASESSQANVPVAAYVSTLLKQHRYKELDVLLSGGSSILNAKAYWTDANYCNYMASTAHQLISLSSCYPVAAPQHNLYESRWGTVIAFCEMDKDQCYPSRSILY